MKIKVLQTCGFVFEYQIETSFSVLHVFFQLLRIYLKFLINIKELFLYEVFLSSEINSVTPRTV